MEKRIRMNEIEPESYKVMRTFDTYLATTALTKTHKELIKIRAAQINGCSYCVDLHTKEARKHGETEQRIYALTCWRETPFFTEEERAILALTEEVTLIQNRLSDATYTNAIKVLGEKYVAQALMAIIAINGWTRIGIATAMEPAADL